MATGNVKKLRIIAYEDPEFQTKAFGEGKSTYETLINPESIKFSYAVKLAEDQAPGTEGTDAKAVKSTPPSISIRFLFDGTGAIANTSRDAIKLTGTSSKETVNLGPVAQQIKEFRDFVYKYSSKTHEPYFVKILYGVILFKGRLETIDFEYKLFAPDGQPLRVIANTKFTGSVSDDLRSALQNFNSPDLTHLRQVKEGDNLPLMCQSIYGNSKYYLEVAKVNGLTNFRKLTPGQRINFPPIEKLSE